jgi:hypothetical protein
MSSRFVEVPAHALRSRLHGAGFVLLPGSGEEVYERRHQRHADFAVKVYTSIARGHDEARGCGEDAIRVVVVRYFAWIKGSTSGAHRPLGPVEDRYMAHGVSDFPRIYRTGSVEAVLDRTTDRAREAYAFINESLKKERESQR